MSLENLSWNCDLDFFWSFEDKPKIWPESNSKCMKFIWSRRKTIAIRLNVHNFLSLIINFSICTTRRLALAKKTQNDADHRALLYNYYNHAIGSHHMENPKRNFDEIDRFGDFDKRNFDEIDRLGSLNDFGKRSPANFDEIDRIGFNEFKKRNFDEIDRLGSLSDF